MDYKQTYEYQSDIIYTDKGPDYSDYWQTKVYLYVELSDWELIIEANYIEGLYSRKGDVCDGVKESDCRFDYSWYTDPADKIDVSDLKSYVLAFLEFHKEENQWLELLKPII